MARSVAAAAAGSIVDVVLCRALAKRLPLRTMFYLCVALGVATTLANFALVDRSLAFVVYFASGVSSVFALVMAGTLAAEVCPGGQEGLCYAAMMSIENAASIASDASGSFMFDAVFHRQLGPLILVSAGFTAVSAILIFLLPARSVERRAA